MSGNLFNSIVFGPVKSRRLGVSLGMNIVPPHIKFCSFNCVYCECGWTEASNVENAKFDPPAEIREELEKTLIRLKEQGIVPDSITFAGNGEPTIHPQFDQIIDDTIALRDMYFPLARVTVLSNSTMLSDERVLKSLIKTYNIMKLDAGTEHTFRLLNKPRVKITLDEVIEGLKKFNGNLVIQTMFIRGKIGEEIIDNTTGAELEALLQHIVSINPKEVMIYSLDRKPPLADLEKISREELEKIAVKIRQLNFKCSVY
ncbi:MAG TPA: radical SAM protein [Bacteroidales bacterium]|nr:radical SAM protein [Bacteroidales bacterium]